MRKLRSDSKWHKVPALARERVIHWLFEDGLGYETALERLEKEFGVKVSWSSLGRFYGHVEQQRAMAGLNLPELDGKQFRAAALKLLEVAAFNAGFDADRPEAGRRFVPLKLLMQQSDSELKEQWLKLELERWGGTGKKNAKRECPYSGYGRLCSPLSAYFEGGGRMFSLFDLLARFA